MISYLLSLALCEELMGLCYVTNALTCPLGYDFVKSVPELSDKLIPGNYYSIFSDTEVPLILDVDKFLLVKEIGSVNKNIQVSYKISFSDSANHPGLTIIYSKLQVTFDEVGTGKRLKDGNSLITFDYLYLKDGATILDSDISCDNTRTVSIIQANTILPYCQGQGALLTIEGDSIVKLEPDASTNLKVTNSEGNTLIIKDNSPFTTINSMIESSDSFQVTGDFSLVSQSILINLVSSGTRAVFTLNGDVAANYKPPSSSVRIMVNVSTNYAIGTNFDVVKYLFTLSSGFEVINGKRSKVPNAPVYCYNNDQEVEIENCPQGGELLWDEDEITEVVDDATKEEVRVNFYGSNLTQAMPSEKMKAKSITFSNEDVNTLNLTIAVNKDGTASFDSKITFLTISINAVLPTDATTTNATLSFNSLMVYKSTAYTSQVGKTSDELSVRINSQSLETDPCTFINLKSILQQPKHLIFSNVTAAEFAGDGQSVTLSQTNETDSFIMNSDMPGLFVLEYDQRGITKVDFKITEKAGLSISIPFSISVNNHAELDANFIGAWSSNKVAVNVDEFSKFVGVKSSSSDTSPSISVTGNGSATLDGKEIHEEEPPAKNNQESNDSNSKHGLGTGAVAGIVIVCIVVVVAAVIVIVIVIKRKRTDAQAIQ